MFSWDSSSPEVIRARTLSEDFEPSLVMRSGVSSYHEAPLFLLE